MPVYKDQKRGTWFVRISSVDPVTGKRIQTWKRGFSRRADAVQWEADQRSARESSPTRITFRELDERYIEYKNPPKESTRIQERTRVDKYIPFADLPVDRITKAVLLDWYVDLTKREDLAISTKNYLIGVVRSVLRFAADFYGMENPSIVLKKLRSGPVSASMSVWSVDELHRFLDAVPEGDYRAFFDFLYWTGCRRGEAMALRISDVDRERRTVRIWHQIKYAEEGFLSLKTDSSERTLRIEPALWARLEAILEARDEGRPFLFGGEKPLAITSIQRHMAAGIAASGVPKIRLHDLRHSFASNAIASGANIVAVSKYLGHATIQQTLETYTHLLERTDEELVGIIGSLDA